jgi:proteasome accessory factor B
MARMMRIHELLSSGKHANCPRLAEEFEVSPKTIQRDIDFMRDQLQLPIDYDPQRHGFRYTEPVAGFPLVTVSRGELVALLVAQKAIEQHRGTSFEKPLRAAFDKLAGSLDGDTAVSLHELSEAVSFRPSGVSTSELKIFEFLSAAVLAHEVVEFDYRSLKATKPERRSVAPYHLACMGNQWYVIGMDEVRGDLRTFALTRLARPRNTRRRFTKPRDFSVSKMLSGSFLAFESKVTSPVLLRFRPDAARLAAEREWHPSQKVRALPDGGIEMRLRVGIAPDLEGWILGWGPGVEVVEPTALRSKIATALRSAADVYAGPATP